MSKASNTQPTPFEAFVQKIAAVPKDEVERLEVERPKRVKPKRKQEARK